MIGVSSFEPRSFAVLYTQYFHSLYDPLLNNPSCFASFWNKICFHTSLKSNENFLCSASHGTDDDDCIDFDDDGYAYDFGGEGCGNKYFYMYSCILSRIIRWFYLHKYV